MHDLMRPITGISGLMELQPGQVNWGDYNPWPLPGAIHMWILRAFGSGGNFVCTYRFRQPLYGSEMYHKGLVETDGVTPSPGGREYAQAMADIVKLRQQYNPNAREPETYSSRRTGFLISFDNRWDIQNHLQTKRWDTEAHWMRYYRALKSAMAPVDVITENSEFDKYPFLVAPAYQLVSQELVKRWEQYVRNGGHLILTSRTGQKDTRGHLWEGPWAEPILGLIGAKIARYDVLPPPITGHIQVRNRSYAWGSWGDILDPNDGTEVLARYSDQFYKDSAAAVTRKLGKGTVSYVGVDTETGDLERDLVHQIFSTAGAAPASLAPDFLVEWRDGFWVATNFTGHAQTIPAPPNQTLLVGEREVVPGGAAIWVAK